MERQTIGFISPPGWIDPSPAEFPSVCAESVQVQQCALRLPGLDWRIDSIAETEPELVAAAGAAGLALNAGIPDRLRLA